MHRACGGRFRGPRRAGTVGVSKHPPFSRRSCGRPRIRGGRNPGVFGRSNSPRKFTGPPGLSPTVQGTDRIGRTPGTPAPSAWPRRHLAAVPAPPPKAPCPCWNGPLRLFTAFIGSPGLRHGPPARPALTGTVASPPAYRPPPETGANRSWKPGSTPGTHGARGAVTRFRPCLDGARNRSGC